MTFNQLILKNLRKNIKHYGMFLFSLLISIILYFSFSTLKYSHSINNSDSSTIIKNGATIGATILFIIIVVFLMYANHLFIKRRTKEFALYQLIGLTRGNILRMLNIEQLVFFIVTGILGTLIGIFGSKLLLVIASKLMKLNTHISIGFEPQAILITIVMLAVAFLLIMIQNYIFLKKHSILALMKDNYTPEATQKRITTFEAIGGILGIIMIVFGYYMSTEMFGVFKALTTALITPFSILFLTIIGAFLFFRSSVSLIFKTLKHIKHGRVNITDVVFTSSIMHRMKKNAMSLTVIAIISAFTVSILCFAAITQSNTNTTLEMTSPDDFNISQNKIAAQFKHKLDQGNLKYHQRTYEVINPKTLSDHVMKSKNGSDMSTNTTSLMMNSHLKGHEAKITNIQSSTGLIDIHLNHKITVKGKSKQSIIVKDKDNSKIYPSQLSFGAPIVEVSPEVYNTLKTDNIVNKMYGFNFNTHKDVKKAEKIASKVNRNIVSHDEYKKFINQSNGILIFVTSFLGIAFLMAAGCIIYIKQMDETEDELDNFKILRRIGFTYTDMSKGLLLKIAFNFGLPLLIALLHALFAALAFMKLLGNVSMSPIFIVMIIYTIVYFIFAMISFIHSSRMIKHSI